MNLLEVLQGMVKQVENADQLQAEYKDRVAARISGYVDRRTEDGTVDEQRLRTLLLAKVASIEELLVTLGLMEDQ